MIDRAFLARLRIEPLDRKKHDRAAFSSGELRVDNFLKFSAAGMQDVETTRCVVACLDPAEEGKPADVVGFYALNAHGILTETLPEAVRKKIGRHETVGAVYLSVVGVDESHQGKGLGSVLLGDAFARSVTIADTIGAAFVFLDALNEDAARLYRRLGFVDLPGHEPRMIVGMKLVRAAVAKAAAARAAAKAAAEKAAAGS